MLRTPRLLIALAISSLVFPSFALTAIKLAQKHEILYLNTSNIEGIDEVAKTELERASRHTGVEFAMVITSAIPEFVSLEDYAASLFHDWKVGENFGGKGILFVFDTSSGNLKIEASYEMEPLFPDTFIHQTEQTWKDYYADSYFGDCISSIILSFMQVCRGAQTTEVWPIIEDSLDRAYNDYVSGGDIPRVLGFKASVEAKSKRIKLLSEKERSKFDKSQSIKETFERYLTSLELGYNDPFLGLLTEGSRYMRLEYPKGASFQKRAAKEFRGKHTIHEKGDLAAIRFEDPMVMALYLRKGSSGFWQFDITKSWAFAQANDALTKFYPSFSDIPWMFAWPEYRELPNYPSTPELLPLGTDLERRIERLEELIATDPENPRYYFELGDLLYFECYWIRSAIDIIEIGLSKRPEKTAYHYRAITMRYRYPDHRNILNLRKQIFEIDPGDVSNRKRLLSLARENDKEKELVELLENQETGPLPTSPTILAAGSGKQKRHKYKLEQNEKQLSFDLRMLRPNEHPDKRSYVYLLLKDDSQKGTYGEVFDFGPEGVQWAYCSSFAEGEEGESGIVSAGPSGSIQITYDWSEDGILKVKSSDRVLNQMPLNVTPDVAFISAHSADAVFAFKK